MRLICYPTGDFRPIITPAPVGRDWMDATYDSFAYRCLPLNIANAHGWMLLNPTPFIAEWDGGDAVESVVIEQPPDLPGPMFGYSHFGAGVLTFRVPGLFRTEPGYDLWVGGPANLPKDAIQPLTAIIETDWLPFTFSMNWRFTRPKARVAFDAGEPFCMIYPIQRGVVETVEPEFRALAAEPELEAAFRQWQQSRSDFRAELRRDGSTAQAQRWQKHYLRGTTHDGTKAPSNHRTKVKLRGFAG
jgi:Family of unknown function (DUF6065)